MKLSIPLFPLAILPLPGELVPLHIFEPRYRQLLADAEAKDITFGILCNHPINKKGIGTLARLESIIKRYPDGRSDIIVKAEDLFTLSSYFETFRTKLYPGGKVIPWNISRNTAAPDPQLGHLYKEYMTFQSISRSPVLEDVYQIANGLNLSLEERYLFLNLPDNRIHDFLWNRLRLQVHILEQEYRSQEVFHMN